MSVGGRLLKSLTLGEKDRFPRGSYIYLLFNPDVVNALLKTNGGETEGLILLFLYFGVLSLSLGDEWCGEAGSFI